MPTHVYTCPSHGDFEVQVRLTEPVQDFRHCPEFDLTKAPPCGIYCGKKSPWKPSAPNFSVQDGTGAGRQAHHPR